MKYKTAFIIQNFFTILIGSLLGFYATNIITALIANSLEDEFVIHLVRISISTIMSIIVAFYSVTEAAKAAAKYEQIPVYDEMKRLVKPYFTIVAIVQMIYTIITMGRYISECKPFIKAYKLIGQKIPGMYYVSIAAYVVCSVIIAAVYIYMIPYTLKKYDKYQKNVKITGI